MKKTVMTMSAAVLGAAFASAGCYDEYAAHPVAYATPQPVTVAVAPPAPVDEVPSPEPYAGAVWMSGYWDWRVDLGRHVWVAGHWGTAPRVGVVYVPPSWHAYPRGGYYRAPGRWVAGVPRDHYGRHLAYDTYGRPHYF